MIEKPMLIDDNVDNIRRIRKEINAQFKTKDEFFDYILKLDQERLRREKRGAGKAKQARSVQSRAGVATGRPMLIDESVEDIHRVRHEISSQFKTVNVLKVEKDGIKRERRERAAKKARKVKLTAAKVGSPKSTRKAI